MKPPYIPALSLNAAFIRDRYLRIVDTRPAADHHGRPVVPRGIWMPSGPKADEGLVCWDRSSGTRERIEERVYAGLLAIDAADPGNQHTIADVLRARGHEAGHLLPVALDGKVGDAWTHEPCTTYSPTDEAMGHPRGCAMCTGVGTIRRPVPAADVSALTLAASVAGVEAGLGVVRVVLPEYRRFGAGYHQRPNGPVGAIVWDAPSHREWGWRVVKSREVLASGPETGPEGRAAADAALLRLGYACLDPAAPFGVVVPFLDMETR